MTPQQPLNSKNARNFPLLAWDLELTEKKSLKKLYAECLREKIDTRPLTKLLSTLYGNAQVAKGLLATLGDKISTTPIVMNRKTMKIQQELALESVWMIDTILTESQDFFMEKSGQS